MCNIVAELDHAGMSDQWIMKNIGMDRDELLRLKQISGLADLFANREFSIPDEVAPTETERKTLWFFTCIIVYNIALGWDYPGACFIMEFIYINSH